MCCAPSCSRSRAMRRNRSSEWVGEWVNPARSQKPLINGHNLSVQGGYGIRLRPIASVRAWRRSIATDRATIKR
jgi:hypothetical protein